MSRVVPDNMSKTSQPNYKVLIEQQLTGQCNEHIHYLNETVGIHKNVLQAWAEMKEAADQAGISLAIASGFRTAQRQLAIWNSKYCGKNNIKNLAGQNIDTSNLSEQEKITAILLYSALPGASRHHWGTDIDVYATNLLPDGTKLQLEPWEYASNGPFSPLTSWLSKHSQSFGFYFPYDKYRNGIAVEPWHLSYMPLAAHYEQQLNLTLLQQTIEQFDIQGKDTIIKYLPMIYQKFIVNVANNPINAGV